MKNYIIKLSPEIIIKSKAVRKKTIQLLNHNISNYLKLREINFILTPKWDHIQLIIKDDSTVWKVYLPFSTYNNYIELSNVDLNTNLTLNHDFTSFNWCETRWQTFNFTITTYCPSILWS